MHRTVRSIPNTSKLKLNDIFFHVPKISSRDQYSNSSQASWETPAKVELGRIFLT